MATPKIGFDPYYKWLGIPPKDQPPNHYRLLGLELFEPDADVIDTAANKQMAYLHSCATGEHAQQAEKLLTELAAARLCLLDPRKKAAYDAQLRAKSAALLDRPVMPKTPEKVEINPLAALAAAQSASSKTSHLRPVTSQSHAPKKAMKSSPKNRRLALILSAVGLILVLVGVFTVSHFLSPSAPESETATNGGQIADKTMPENKTAGNEPAYSTIHGGGPSAGDLFPDAKGVHRTPSPANPTPSDSTPTAPGIARDTPDTTQPAAPATLPATEDQAPVTASAKPAPEPLPATKLPVPSGAALKNAMQLVNEAYNSDLIAATTSPQKTVVANKILQDAAEEKDATARFALLSKARELTIAAGDFGALSAVIDLIDIAYQVDALKMRADAALAASQMIQDSDHVEVLVPQMNNIADEALAADRYDIARSMTERALDTARSASAVELQRNAAYKLRKIRETQTAYDNSRIFRDTLAVKPIDPDANLNVGKFRCFIKGDWSGGLPLLALGSNATLKAMATKEIAGTADANSQAALGDDWWAVAEKETGLAKSQIQNHAGMWYSQADAALTGLAKAKMDIRLKAIVSDDSGGAVNLLKLVDVARDTIAGRWEFRDRTLISDNSAPATIQFLYRPPEEYDYRVVFTNVGGVALLCRAMGSQFCLQIGSGPDFLIGFADVAGKDAYENSTTVHRPEWLKSGMQCTAILKIRKGGVQAFLNDHLITQLKTDYSNMSPSPHWPLPRNDTIGLGTYSPPSVFSFVEIIEITGKGRQLNAAAP